MEDRSIEINSLVEEINARIHSYRFDRAMSLIEFYHGVGGDICAHPSYQKSRKGTGEFLESIADQIKISPSTLYKAVSFRQQFPDLSMFLETNHPQSWTKDVVPLLPGYEKKEKTEPTCKKCPIHCEKDQD